MDAREDLYGPMTPCSLTGLLHPQNLEEKLFKASMLKWFRGLGFRDLGA